MTTSDMRANAGTDGYDSDGFPDPPKYFLCTTCTYPTHEDDILKAPCGRRYCTDCLEELHYECTSNAMSFEPGCCHKPWARGLAQDHLVERGRSLSGQKPVRVAPGDRVYCSEPSCGYMIKPCDYMGPGHAFCLRCASYTCMLCKGPLHIFVEWLEGEVVPTCIVTECPNKDNVDTAPVCQAAAENEREWKECPSCHFLVERKDGRNHMACICKSEFCFVCGDLLKYCACNGPAKEKRDEHIEVVAHIKRVDSGQDSAECEAQSQPAVQQPQTQPTVQQPQARKCVHTHSKRIWEPGARYHCEICTSKYKIWIRQCQQCSMILCNDCSKRL